ncbi:polyhydroxyalkanoic acid system family protein [Altererythrobacter sp.]|nr:polyhydroxyalkanoic acid system family protein [Altererythrobacter sp.]
MRVPIPHELPKEEVRRRLRERSHEMADHIPGPMAEVVTDWPSEDRMHMTIRAMGHDLVGTVDIEDTRLMVEVTIPPLLSFMEGTISGAMQTQGQKLLAKD